MDLPNHILFVLGMMVSLLFEKGWRCYGCLEQERNALSQIKASFSNPINATWARIPSYYFDQQMKTPWETDSNCCNWEKVKCNNITGRVTGLDLSFEMNYLNLGEMYLNVSLFTPFEELKELYLDGNQISGCIENEGFERLARLSKLKQLSLSDNNFDDTILSSLKGLRSLKYLDLGYNGLKGPFNLKELDSLSNLQELILEGNEITKFMASIDDHGLRNLSKLSLHRVATNGRKLQLQSLEALPNLRTLDLSGNKFEGAIFGQELQTLTKVEKLFLDESSLDESSLESLGALPSLKYLSMTWLDGALPSPGFPVLKKLEFLDLSLSTIENNFTQTIGMLTSLETLLLVNCSLSGTLHQVQGLCGLKHIQELTMSYNDLTGTLPWCLTNLTSLKRLDLSSNQFISEGFERLSKLSKLEILDLSYNNFNKTILSSLKGLSSLKLLYMGYNRLKGTFDFKDLDGLSNLKKLDLRGNKIDRVIASTGFPNLKKLEFLDLGYSDVKKNSLQTIGMLTSLKMLLLNDCSLSGMLPTVQGLCELKQLQELSMNNNDITGTLPGCFANLTSLKWLDLSSNRFNGDISPITRLTSIQCLVLSENNFQVPFSLGSFFNHSKLKILYAQNNEIQVEKEEMHNLTPKFQLEDLILSSYKVSYAEKFPEFLRHQHRLQYVYLSHIRISGSGFPYWLLENNANLEELVLVDNSLSGPLRLPNLSHLRLNILIISGNSFLGHIPEEIGTTFQSLGILDMSRNAFNGSIPSSVGNMYWLLLLDLSSNRLSGRIPESLAMGCPSLYGLILSNNSLEGQIFSKNFNLQQLSILLLDDNNFTGGIPDSLFNNSLIEFDARNNSLSGKIPTWMGNMSSLRALDLSHNHISGTLPSNFCPSSLTKVYLSNNQLLGSLTDAFYNCSRLQTIDISHNHFTGGIPEWIGGFSRLKYLLLGHNNLKGEIPIQLCKLEYLNFIDLSNNSLSGRIIPCLGTSSWFGVCNPLLNERPQAFNFRNVSMEQYLEITAKHRSDSYKRCALLLLSGIDLSSNNFVGEIPPAIGNLSGIKVINLSHNSLTGPIPSTFSNLGQIESLDLSYNKLDGQIPPQLVRLFSLSSFSVAHNNLSGKTPEWVAQFATFDQSSYEGNPFLCGLPLPSCTTPERNSTDHSIEEDNSLIDMETFYVSFIVSYIIVLMGIGAVLFINSYWRRRWLYFIEIKVNSFYYFFMDNFSMLSKFIAP